MFFRKISSLLTIVLRSRRVCRLANDHCAIQDALHCIDKHEKAEWFRICIIWTYREFS